MNRACVVALASGLAVSVSVDAGEISWANPVDGLWNNAANWSPAMVPSNASDRAVLGLSGPYTVSLNVNPTISGVRIENPEAVLEIDAGRFLTVGTDGLYNDGWLIVNPTAGGATTSFSITENFTLDGAGLLTLNGFSSRARIIGNDGVQMTHGVNHTINGYGQISASFDNLGWIAADVPAQTLQVFPGSAASSGVLSAIDGGILLLQNMSLDQTGGGIIEAGGGTVTFTGSTIIGGMLMNSGAAGSRLSINTNTLDAVSISGDSELNAGSTATIAGGSLTNDGLFTVNPTSAGATTTLAFNELTLISGNGTIRLNGLSSRARMLGAGVSVENSANHRIRGFGQILVDLVNSGLVSADIPIQILDVNGGMNTNLSTMRAESDGILLFTSTTVDQSETAELLADGGTLRLTNTVVNNGRLRNAGTAGSSVVVTGSLTLNDVTIVGDVIQNAGQAITLQGVTDGPGTILVNPTNGGAVTSIFAAENTELAGTGAIRLSGSTVRARIISDPGVDITQGSDRSVMGFGQFSAGFVNNGLVQADIPSQTMLIDGQTKVNNADFRAVAGGALQFQNVTVDQMAGGVIEADGGDVSLSGTTVLGGTVRNTGAPDSEMEIQTCTFDSVLIDGDSTLSAGNALTVAGGILTNNGVLAVNPNNGGAVTTITGPGGTIINGSGEVVLGGITVRARLLNSEGDVLTLGSGQTLSGIGQVAATTQLDGTLAPGFSVGTMTATRPLLFADTSTYACEFNDSGASDRFDSTSTVALDGSLDIAFIDGFDPTTPAAFQIITTGTNGVTGRFDQITGDGPDLPLITRVVYESNRVRVGFVCPSDANLDGATDLGDLNAVLANFGTNASLGDVTGDGSVDLADLNLVLANFGTDCTD